MDRTSYDGETGLPTSSTLPGSAGTSTAQTTVTTYYTTAVNHTYERCGGKPEWADLVCRTGPGGQPTVGTGRSAIPATYVTKYTLWNTPETVTVEDDTVPTPTVLRTSHTDLDQAGRPVADSVTTTSSAASVAVPATTTDYWPLTGLVQDVKYTDSTGALRQIVNTYDSVGRRTNYQDVDTTDTALAATTAFDLQDRPISTTDGKGTQTRTFDEITGDLTTFADSDAGSFTPTYSPAGELSTVSYPGGLDKTFTTDETGTVTDLTYKLTGACAPDCVLLTDSADRNIFGEQINHTGPIASQTYGYDPAGRLTGVQDQVGDTCTSRAYLFDPAADNSAGKDSNRAGEATTTGATGAPCPAVPTSAQVNHTYDTADRLTDPGYNYDSLGRTTTVPAAGTADASTQSPSYCANDLIATLGSSSYTLDPINNRFRSITSPAGTSIRHYAGGSDSPSWTTDPANPTTGYSRNISGLTGDLAAVRNYDGTLAIQLGNLHGDIIATTTLTPGTDRLTGTFESTEFGTPRATADIGTRTYGWLGTKTREANNPSGLVLMGVRLYNPTLGRFLQTDPIHGGSCNDYDYACQDPVNESDLSGQCLEDLCVGEVAVAWWVYASIAGAGAVTAAVTLHNQSIHVSWFSSDAGYERYQTSSAVAVTSPTQR